MVRPVGPVLLCLLCECFCWQSSTQGQWLSEANKASDDVHTHTTHKISSLARMLLSFNPHSSGMRFEVKSGRTVKSRIHHATEMVAHDEFEVPGQNNEDPASATRRKLIVAAMAGLGAEAAWREAVSTAANALEAAPGAGANVIPPVAIQRIEAGYPVVIKDWIPKELVAELVADMRTCYKKGRFVNYLSQLTNGSMNDGRYFMTSFNEKTGGSHVPPFTDYARDESQGPFVDPSLGNFALRQSFKARMAQVKAQLAQQLQGRQTLADDFQQTHEMEYIYYTPGTSLIRHCDDRHIEFKRPNGTQLPKRPNPTRRSVTWMVYLNDKWQPPDGGQLRFHVRAQPSVAAVGARGADLQVGWLQATATQGEQPVFLDARRPGKPDAVNAVLYTFDAAGTRRDLSREPFRLYEPAPDGQTGQVVGGPMGMMSGKLQPRTLVMDDLIDVQRFRSADAPKELIASLPQARNFDGELTGDIAPEAGTLVIFDSVSVPHEVLQTTKERFAIQGWFHEKLYSA